MQLIVKPTSRCNFACKFCSAANLNIRHLDHVSDKLKDFIQRLNPQNIIVTGGDPLCVEPSFYNELLEIGGFTVSLTTNLKSFVLNPDKWIPILTNSRIGTCTSFQYGSGRMYDSKTEYTEEMFRKTFQLFEQKVGYKLKFISVISSENEHLALKHLELARELQTKCKLNAVMALGKTEVGYPLHKILDIWLQAKEQHLDRHLDLDVCLQRGGCNLNVNRLCRSTIRAVQVEKDGSLRIANCEDDLLDYSIPSMTVEEACVQEVKQEAIQPQDAIDSKCMLCELFYVCNGCHQWRKANKLLPEHCQEMLKLKDRIKKSGWKIQ